jgi:hypothetical protein
MPHADHLLPRAARGFVLSLLICILAACGGGDGGSSAPPAPTTPTQPATPDTTVKPEMRCAP